MKELKLVKEKTPVDQIKASEIDLNKHIVISKGLAKHYVLMRGLKGIILWVDPNDMSVFASKKETESLEDFLIKHEARIFEL